MQKFKAFLHHVFIDGLSGMALGLFATLIVGTILAQLASAIPGAAGAWASAVAGTAKVLTGAGIGVGVAVKFKSAPLTILSAAACGMVGAYASKLLAGTLVSEGAVVLAGPGEPLGAFIAALVGIEIGTLVAGKTKLDILLIPLVTIISGSAVGLLVGPPISGFMTWLGSLINWGVEQQPFLMGIVVSVLMGIFLTLPISSAAIGILLGLSGIAAGAATAGCCAHMVGFAVMSFRENRWGGLFAQGVGTSMLQMPNLVRKPLLWIPPVIASAITGPVSSVLLGMTSNATGSGMGTAGLVGPIMTFQTMTGAGVPWTIVLLEILGVYFLAPAAICLAVSEFMRKRGWIQFGDLKLDA